MGQACGHSILCRSQQYPAARPAEPLVILAMERAQTALALIFVGDRHTQAQAMNLVGPVAGTAEGGDPQGTGTCGTTRYPAAATLQVSTHLVQLLSPTVTEENHRFQQSRAGVQLVPGRNLPSSVPAPLKPLPLAPPPSAPQIRELAGTPLHRRQHPQGVKTINWSVTEPMWNCVYVTVWGDTVDPRSMGCDTEGEGHPGESDRGGITVCDPVVTPTHSLMPIQEPPELHPPPVFSGEHGKEEVETSIQWTCEGQDQGAESSSRGKGTRAGLGFWEDRTRAGLGDRVATWRVGEEWAGETGAGGNRECGRVRDGEREEMPSERKREDAEVGKDAEPHGDETREPLVTERWKLAVADALLSLGSVIDIAGLQQAVKEALSAVLPRVETVYTYLLDGESRLVCEDPPHELLQEGKVREAVISQKRLGCNGLGPSDLPGKPLARLVAPLAPGTQVLVIPLVDKEAGAVAGVILVHCGQLSDSEEWSLQLYDLDASSLQLKVLQYLQQETGASRCCLLLVSEDNLQLSCKVIGEKVLEEEISFPLTMGRLGQVVEDKKSIQLKDLTSEDVQQLQNVLGCGLQAMLCVPVISRATDQVVALACAFNKLGGDLFTEQDEHVIQHCFHYTSTVLTSTLAFQKEQKLKCECQALLQVAKNLFTHLDDVSVLLQEIITEARNLSNAEICSVFLLDQNELVAKVFDGGVVDDESYEIRIPADQGIAGHVATTGQILNIPDAYAHPLFYRGVDDSTGFRTRNILCFPIKNENQEVIGVAELVNKINGPWFSKFDEDLATAFSIYCGISIAHSLLYKKVNEAQYRSHLANEMMMYHMKVSDDEYTKLLYNGIQPVAAIDSNFASFTYTPRSLPEDDTSMAILSMLQDMNFINNYKIDCPTLARFCLMVKKGYRDPPYHNWMHAFSVSHFCYLLYKNLELANYLEDIEIFALFISCMCHDLDHRGTNNSFQVASKSVLAALYSSEGSVMERHHFAQAIAILNTHGCNIFDHFSRKDYQRMLDLMRDIILATDLAHHLRIFKDLQKMAEVGYDRTNKQHHSLLLCLLMTSCDLSDQTKGWKTTRKIAELIYKEFFSQGDLEKAMGNRPMEMMDREKAYIPELQISFMEHIAMPIYKLLQDLFPKAAELYERVASNREHWTKVSHKFTIRGLPSNNSLDFLDEEYEVPKMDGAGGPVNGCCSLDAE
nr:cGMP-dependent 3',5'-cyclic phosphodiesterase [Loxodonta africana]